MSVETTITVAWILGGARSNWVKQASFMTALAVCGAPEADSCHAEGTPFRPTKLPRHRIECRQRPPLLW